MKILIVDDEKLLVKGIKFNFEQDGYTCVAAYDGEEAVKMAKDKSIDLIILDLMLPKVDGLSACQKIREFSNVPIVMLTAKNEDMDKIMGLEYGADDYISKPFGIRELMARIKAVLRRYEATADLGGSSDTVISVGDLSINVECHEVKIRDRSIDLTLKEFELLRYLVENRGHVFTRDQLLNSVWGIDYAGETRTVDVHIRHLRQKLSDGDNDEQYIETIRGKGYKVK